MLIPDFLFNHIFWRKEFERDYIVISFHLDTSSHMIARFPIVIQRKYYSLDTASTGNTSFNLKILIFNDKEAYDMKSDT